MRINTQHAHAGMRVVVDVERRAFGALVDQALQQRQNGFRQPVGGFVGAPQVVGVRPQRIAAVGAAHHQGCFFKRGDEPQERALVEPRGSGKVGKRDGLGAFCNGADDRQGAFDGGDAVTGIVLSRGTAHWNDRDD
ncbi:hypothetical protein D3C72_1318880 [compost metagenome]